MTTGLDVFDRGMQKSNQWLKELEEQLGSDDRRHAYRVLRGCFQVLRDRLPVAEAAQLAGPTEASVAAEAATRVLADRVSGGEVRQVLSVLPGAVREVLQPAAAS